MRSFLVLICCLYGQLVLAGWTNLNTGINDNITGVVFWGSNGLVSGQNGLYYTTTGGNGAGSWTRFNITGNTADSLVYNHTSFTHAYADPSSGTNKVYVCGTDQVAGTAIIMLVNLPSLTYSMLYTGPAGSVLNRINYNPQNSLYYAVGNNGLIVYFNASTANAIAATVPYNLSAISFSGTQFCLGANGVNINGVNNSNVFTYSVTSTPGYNYVGVICTGTNYGFGAGNSYYRWLGTGPVDQPNYDFGTLNARCLTLYGGSMHFVGTDHGIFRSTSSYTFLEWQPTSLNYAINAIWAPSTGPGIYACGDNGTVLYSTDAGGTPKPVAKLDALLGDCKGKTMTIGGITGSSTNCQWRINGAVASSSCGSFSHTFSTVGQYTVEVDVSSGPGLYDTSIRIINIVDTPNINLPVTLSKSVLCHQEPITIGINSSQANVDYVLEQFGSTGNFGYSGPGNGSIINFTSVPLSDAGNYYLSAQSTISMCARNFTDTIKIAVEKTKAAFHQSKVNVTVGEPLTVYQHCVDAQNYLWTFSPNASPASAGTPVASLSFASLGSTQIKLVCWSNHGCYDSTLSSGPAVYAEPATPDSCWTMVNNGTDGTWTGIYYPDISQLSNSKSGFFTCGYFRDEAFASRYGDSLRPDVSYGGYLLKCNDNGVAKWMVYSKYEGYYNNQYELAKTVKEDKAGNIYVGGLLSGPFIDNKGDSTFVTPPTNSVGYLAKLDSMGNLKWILSGNFTPHEVTVDYANNLILTASIAGTGTVGLSLNGAPTFTIPNNATVAWNSSVLKLDSSGNVLWHSGIRAPYSYELGEVKADVDKNNNVYITGCFQYYAYVYKAGSTVTYSLSSTNGVAGQRMFVAKYSPAGTVQWLVKSQMRNAINDMQVPYDILTDSVGNSYISGRNHITYYTDYQDFENTDGTTSSLNAGEFFLVKVNPSGVCRWMEGGAFSYYGFGFQINQWKNEISVLGQIKTNTATQPAIATFTSMYNDTLSFTIGGSDYFIAVYDTSGDLLRITANGNNAYMLSNTGPEFPGLFRKPDGAYYLSRNMQFNNNMYNYDNFGTNIYSCNGRDGTVTKFYPAACGITYMPPPHTTNVGKNTAQGFSVYPNPSHGSFRVEAGSSYAGKKQITLIDCLGRVAYQQETAEDKIYINTQNLAAGVYTLYLKSGDKTGVKKITIE